MHVDMWRSPLKAERILDRYGHGEEPLPVYKMPHLEGWAAVGDRLLLPAVGRHELIAVDTRSFTEAGRVATHGQPVFAVARPDGRHVWVNFAHPLNDTIDIVDTQTLKVIHRFAPGPAVLHMEFTPRGNEVWVSLRDADRVDIYDAATFAKKAADPGAEAFGHLLHRTCNEDWTMSPDPAELTLVDRWQHNFPLVDKPFAVVGRSAALNERETIRIFRRLHEIGVISRIGAVVRPNTVGASTLAALQVPRRAAGRGRGDRQP